MPPLPPDIPANAAPTSTFILFLNARRRSTTRREKNFATKEFPRSSRPHYHLTHRVIYAVGSSRCPCGAAKRIHPSAGGHPRSSEAYRLYPFSPFPTS
ncbi:unnamed protein product [Acanthoscelides obtectus]|uniref:Uncharacterized protein n=1 Tax=Acanthoscelides obtectus TaxID=200917 RepID=A0A9P0P7M2_ACAOB|nr:unnamed protein product [Acanthoscelides obtectus]CAK1640892.1 hypothetical protein AOBTE_LOCUS12002 [Acanthoscelides obtectus]